MKKIGITGSLASGKTTASKILSSRKGPLFSADKIVRKLYKRDKFKKIIIKKFGIKKNSSIKSFLRKKILQDQSNIRVLEKIIHPLVRKKMRSFTLKNRNKKLLFFEIPLLIESKLMNFFDYIILVVASRKNRIKRYLKKGGSKKMFYLLDKNQIPAKRKIKYCDYLIVNNKTKNYLKKQVAGIVEIPSVVKLIFLIFLLRVVCEGLVALKYPAVVPSELLLPPYTPSFTLGKALAVPVTEIDTFITEDLSPDGEYEPGVYPPII